MGKITEIDRLFSLNSQAEVELAHICAAIDLARATNDMGCEIRIGQLSIGVSVNERIIPILEAERDEILKYLRGESNNWQ